MGDDAPVSIKLSQVELVAQISTTSPSKYSGSGGLPSFFQLLYDTLDDASRTRQPQRPAATPSAAHLLVDQMRLPYLAFIRWNNCSDWEIMVLCPIGTQIIYNYGSINQPIRMAALKPKPIPAILVK